MIIIDENLNLISERAMRVELSLESIQLLVYSKVTGLLACDFTTFVTRVTSRGMISYSVISL